MTIWQQRLKRLIDITCAAAGLALTLPVQIVVACAIRITIGRPILFRQVRVGRDAELFTLVKFRTMRDVSSSEGLLSDEDRLTRLGRLLRSSSVDELPTLWNVLRGDMSLVGPRPLLPEYLPLYNARQAMRHNVRPGVTGLAQVNGRNAIDWPDRLELDVRYVEQHSLSLDSKILLRTFTTVLRRSGISQPGHATMSKFSGTPDATESIDK